MKNGRKSDQISSKNDPGNSASVPVKYKEVNSENNEIKGFIHPHSSENTARESLKSDPRTPICGQNNKRGVLKVKNVKSETGLKEQISDDKYKLKKKKSKKNPQKP